LLILRIYDVWNGSIRICDAPIKQIKLKSLKDKIGIVLQEPMLWNDTIGNNIRYGKDDATESEVRRVAQLACVDEFVNDLPRRYETVIGENACKLSEGQKQKIAIARALIKKSNILILDEAMSSIDSESEKKILLNIKQQENTMLITASHRLSTVMAADLVYYLSGPGEMIIDSYSNIIKNNKQFSDLFINQYQKEFYCKV